MTIIKPNQVGGGGQGDGRPGEMGAGGVREAGEEGTGSGIPKVAGSGKKREKLRNIAQYFAIEKMQRGGSNKYGRESGLKGTGSGRFKPPCPLPPTINVSKSPKAMLLDLDNKRQSL